MEEKTYQKIIGFLVVGLLICGFFIYAFTQERKSYQNYIADYQKNYIPKCLEGENFCVGDNQVVAICDKDTQYPACIKNSQYIQPYDKYAESISICNNLKQEMPYCLSQNQRVITCAIGEFATCMK